MKDPAGRIGKKELLDRVVPADQAAQFFKGGMVVATSGNALSGYPKEIFAALAARMQREPFKIDLMATGPLGPEVEEALVRAGGLRRRIGTVGTRLLREAINRREVGFLEGKSGRLAQYARWGYYGPVDLAVIEAAGIDGEGNILPGTTVYDAPDWVDLAPAVLLEINWRRPVEMAGMHDIYSPRPGECLPLTHVLQRIGRPTIPLDAKKVKGIVLSDGQDREVPPARMTEKNRSIARHLILFLQREANRRGGRLPPLEVGIGEVMLSFLSALAEADLPPLSFFLAAATDPLLELVETGRAEALSCNSLRFSRAGLARLASRLDSYRPRIILRSAAVTNSAEVISRLGLLAINSCLEADVAGQVNSSHLRGSMLVGGIAGSYDYARNSALSIFALPATTGKGDASTIVSRVSHVDHTEHEVDVLVTEHGVADLRALEPYERAAAIIDHCAAPPFRDGLRDYVARSWKKPGRAPAGE